MHVKSSFTSSSSHELKLCNFKGLGAGQGKQHKDPGKGTGGLEPSVDQANTSLRVFCTADNKTEAKTK